MDKSYIYASYIMEPSIYSLRVWDLMRMTHLNMSFALIHDDIVTVDHLQFLDRIAVYKRVNPALRVNISIGGWGADGFSQAAASPAGRARFIESALAIVRKWDFDGIDIDWEYPCSDKAKIAYCPDDKHNFTLLMQELRQSLNAAGKESGTIYELSCAVGGGAYFVEGTEMDEVAKVVDYVNLMTYDLRGGFEYITGHHTNLYPQTGDENGPSGVQTVELFHKAGVPYDKMVYGSAFYGRMWDNVKTGDHNGLGQPSDGTGGFGGIFDLLDDDAAASHGFTRYWDEQAQAPWLWDGKRFISFEDTRSLKAKCDYVKEKGLAGLMYWAYGNHKLFEIPAHELLGFPLPPVNEFD